MGAQILIADDDAVNSRLLTNALTMAGYEVHAAANGADALKRAEELQPDLIILDVMMPEMDGYEVCRRLRRRTDSMRLPILMLTAQDSLEEKIRGLDAGADDYMTKPFEQAELLARVKVLLRRAGERSRDDKAQKVEGKVIATFSLRGGVGVSTLAANLAVNLAQLWDQPAVLVDLASMAGESALMFNLAPRASWLDLAPISSAEIEPHVVGNLLMPHDSGVLVLAAPRRAEKGQVLGPDQVARVLTLLSQRYHYVVLDLPHDFRDSTMAGMDVAHDILAILAPDLVSASGMTTALDMFEARHYSRDTIHLVLNHIFERKGLDQKQIEQVLKDPFDLVIPYEPEVLQAINLGVPLMLGAPNSPTATLLADFAFALSKEEHRKQTPAKPTKLWQRVTDHAQSRRPAGLRRLFK